MRLFGLSITRAVPSQALQPVSGWGGFGSGRGWWPLLVRDHYPGAWQRNDEIRVADVLAFPAVFACVSLIASDIGKLRVKLVKQDANGIWSETESAAFSPVLRKPNHYQTRIKFYEQWITSKLVHGNTYVLKERDQRGVVVAMTVLDPQRVSPLVAPNGEVYYELQRDDLAGVQRDGNVVVPAREIIHDLMIPLYHPLVGVSPIYACGLAALQGLKIQNNSVDFFANGSNPGGVLTAPGAISDETAKRLKDFWDTNYSGANVGKVAVLGDGLKYEPMTMSAVDAQLIEQLKWTAETVCSCFHVPPYKIGLGAMPTNNNVQTLNIEYYSQCLQSLIESAEESLDEGLGLGWGVGLGTEFDVENLLRMDTLTQMEAIEKGVRAGVLAPNEGRRRLDLAPVKGGDTPYLQQQNFSLAALDERDHDDPFAKPAAPSLPPPADEDGEAEDAKRRFDVALSKAFAEIRHAA